MVTDAVRNMFSALIEADLKGIRCMAHKLHLVMHDALGLGSQLCEKQEEMGMTEHVPVQDMHSWWSSTLDMIARLVEQKDVLEAMMSTTTSLPGVRELDISSTSWLSLGQMVDILRLFEETPKVL
ncbi:hypothetical protein JRQ81_005879 [Phrynocephalus forsythii]|uniref:Uncharacterized protein n=1 Tax=Phrynocephalus forsythii TaxID=171643 RepID=A0A9Q1B6Z3_9SAUR|nr:hypothetical protein JRQ81_005879 [Phrynocephalus forsythii]